MSVSRRIWNLVRSEITALRDRASDRFSDVDLDSELFGDSAGSDPPTRPTGNSEQDQLNQYYANLELEPGASLKEVKSAYRRLMRRYHPDRHAKDPAKVRLANELSQQLRVAYEALREHLKRRRT